MRRRVVAPLSACALALTACGATQAIPSEPTAHAATSAHAPTSAACTATVRAEMTDVAHRVYEQAVGGRNETASRARLARSRSLAAAVAARDPHAVRAALRPLLRHQITRIEITAAGRRLASIGHTAAFAPSRGVIVAHGRVVGRYVMAVSSVSSYRGLVRGLTGAHVRFGRSAGADASLPARRYPTGRTRIALTFPAVPSSLCGATAADTRLNTIGLVARNVMANEASSPATARTVHRVARDPAFRRAVATRDPVALRAAIVGFFRDDRYHIVRVRAWSGTRLIGDVGGPYVLSPALGTVRGPGGAIAGRFMLAVQDDTGLIKLVHRFTGADVVLHMGSVTVPGSDLEPGPSFSPGLSTVRYGGRSYRADGITGTSFPTGRLDVSMLVP
jgi:hypothetical protein